MTRTRGRSPLRMLAAVSLALTGVALGGATNAKKQAHPGNEARTCYERALEETTLTTNDAVALCTGATTHGPIECFLEGDEQTLLSQELIVTLCRCAGDTSPVRCYETTGRNATLTNQQIVALCSPSVQGTLFPSCEPAGRRPAEPEED